MVHIPFERWVGVTSHSRRTFFHELSRQYQDTCPYFGILEVTLAPSTIAVLLSTPAVIETPVIRNSMFRNYVHQTMLLLMIN